MLRFALVFSPRERLLEAVPRDPETSEWVDEFSDLLTEPMTDLLKWGEDKTVTDEILMRAAEKFERDLGDHLFPLPAGERDPFDLVEVRACKRVGWGSLVEIGKPS